MRKPKTHGLTAERARQVFHYDPDTGRLSWRINAGKWGNIPAGTEAGAVVGRPGNRYRQVFIDGHTHKAHRIAYLIVTGDWPEHQIDHRDHDGLNNCWRNLRSATNRVNGQNRKQDVRNKSGVTGVCWEKNRRKWYAQIGVNGAVTHLGLFDDLSEAVEARKAAEREHGFHPNHGQSVR